MNFCVVFAFVIYLGNFNCRLDFEQNTIEAPSVTTEASGGACVDSMTVTVSMLRIELLQGSSLSFS